MRYATCKTWAEYFKDHEDANVGYYAIQSRLKKAEKFGESGRNKIGKLFKNVFYSEVDIRSVCAELLQVLPQADESGAIRKDGTVYLTRAALSKAFGISEQFITKRAKDLDIQPIRGKTRLGRILDYYPKQVISEACVGSWVDFQADESGFFEKDSVRHGSIEAWSQKLPIARTTITKYLLSAQSLSIKGKSSKGKILDFYAENIVRSLFENHLRDFPVSDKSGFFEKDGERHGTIFAWARVLPIANPTIKMYLENEQVSAVRGRDSGGRITDFYSEFDVRHACAHLLNPNIPKVDKTGFFEKDGKKYGTIKIWSRTHSISTEAIKRRLNKAKVHSIRGRDWGGKERDFYSEPDVCRACADLLHNIPHSEESGFFENDGIRYGTVRAWSQVLPISKNSIRRNLKKSQAHPIKAKSISGHVEDFYSESDVRLACANPLQEMPLADKCGFFKIGDIRYGHSFAWNKELKISYSTILRRLEKIHAKPLDGKAEGGHTLKFYSEYDVRRACAHLINKRNLKRS